MRSMRSCVGVHVHLCNLLLAVYCSGRGEHCCAAGGGGAGRGDAARRRQPAAGAGRAHCSCGWWSSCAVLQQRPTCRTILPAAAPCLCAPQPVPSLPLPCLPALLTLHPPGLRDAGVPRGHQHEGAASAGERHQRQPGRGHQPECILPKGAWMLGVSCCVRLGCMCRCSGKAAVSSGRVPVLLAQRLSFRARLAACPNALPAGQGDHGQV